MVLVLTAHRVDSTDRKHANRSYSSITTVDCSSSQHVVLFEQSTKVIDLQEPLGCLLFVPLQPLQHMTGKQGKILAQEKSASLIPCNSTAVV